MHVQEDIHFAQVQEEEGSRPRLNVFDRLVEYFRVRQTVIGIDSMFDALLRKLVEDRRCPANASAIVDVLFLYIVEPGQESGTYAAFKQRAHSQDSTPEFFHDFAGDAVIQNHIRQELQES